MRAPLGSLQLPKDPWDPPRFNHPPLRIRSACNPSTLRPRSFRSDGTWLVSRQAVAGGTHSPEALNPETLGSGLLPLSRVWGYLQGDPQPQCRTILGQTKGHRRQTGAELCIRISLELVYQGVFRTCAVFVVFSVP